jgi:hypothetical protein
MFIQNKYTKWYHSIINNARDRLLEGYTEKHHIIPKSLGGTDDDSNIIRLTAREHYICHLLLTKMVEGESKMKMTFAYIAMTGWKNKMANRTYRYNSRLFESLRKGYKLSDETKNKIRAKAIGRKASPETRQKMSQSHTKEKLPKPPKGPRKHSEETKQKISEARKKQVFTEETFQKISKSNKGRKPWHAGLVGVYKRSEEVKKRMSEAQKLRWAKSRSEKAKTS